MSTPPPSPDADDPALWLGNTPMLNLEDDKLRLRVQTVLQFSRSDAEKLMCIANYVASIPFNVPAFAGMKRTHKTLARRQAVGWYSKAALFMAMLRTAGFPARVRMVRIPPEMFRGLVNTTQRVLLPVVEVWAHQRWVVTDSYLYDPLYLAAAREALQRQGWSVGYGLHRDGHAIWNGVEDALVMIVPDRSQGPVPAQFAGVYDDPQAYAAQLRHGSPLRWLFMVVRNRILSVRMNAQVRALRRDAGG